MTEWTPQALEETARIFRGITKRTEAAARAGRIRPIKRETHMSEELDLATETETETPGAVQLNLDNTTEEDNSLAGTLLRVIDDNSDLDIQVATAAQSTKRLLSRICVERGQGTSNAAMARTCKEAVESRPGVNTQFAFPGSDQASKRLYTLPTTGASMSYWVVTALIVSQPNNSDLDIARVFRAARTLVNVLSKTDSAMTIAEHGVDAKYSITLLEQEIEAEEKRRAEEDRDEEDTDEESTEKALKNANVLIPGTGSLDALAKILNGESNPKYEDPAGTEQLEQLLAKAKDLRIAAENLRTQIKALL